MRLGDLIFGWIFTVLAWLCFAEAREEARKKA